MKIKLSQPFGLMAVVTDVQNRISEALDVDHIAILEFVVNTVIGFARVHMALGGMDSNGQFHPSPAHAQDGANITITRDKNPAEFAQFLAPDGTVRLDFTQAFWEDLAESAFIPLAHQFVWGDAQKFPEMEVELNGKKIFSKGKREVPKP